MISSRMRKSRDELNLILNYSPVQDLTSEEKDLLWKFRYHLTRDKRGLTKFLKSVIWSDRSEVRHAIGLLSQWTEIDVDNALELLGPSFIHPAVREHAVNRLRKADTAEIRLYLLQLVQALKFEVMDAKSNNTSPLGQFLIERSMQDPILGNDFLLVLDG